MEYLDNFFILLKDPVFLLSVGLMIALSIISFKNKTRMGKQPINQYIKKKESKVVDIVITNDMEDLAQFKDGKLVMCRCWKSETFPYCDGSHVKHNAECKDNIGPLIIKKVK